MKKATCLLGNVKKALLPFFRKKKKKEEKERVGEGFAKSLDGLFRIRLGQ
jgi:hypothetical protein